MKKKKKNKNKIVLGKMTNRLKFLKGALLFLFLVIFIRIGFLIFFDGNYYAMLLDKKTDMTVYGDSTPRGRIYDRNYKVIVDNVVVKEITYSKVKGVTKEEEIKLAYLLSEHLALDYDNLLTRNLKEFYYALNEELVNFKITDEEWEDYDNRKITSSEIEELKIERITDEELKTLKEADRKAAYLYYLMNRGYYYDEKSIKVEATDEEYAYVVENSQNLKGFKATLDWERVYPYGDVFSLVLGKVSSKEAGVPMEDKEYYLSLGYDLDDRVGISGLEKEYEEVLSGTKAMYQVMDDNSLKIIKEGTKGNDIVLTIDIEVQKEIEEMLKQELVKTKKEPNTEFYNRSFVVITNPSNGEIIAMAGKQLFEEQKTGKTEIYDYSNGPIVSTVTPGSVVKGASILVGYNTGVIKIGTKLLDQCIKLYNTPAKCSWRTMGVINDLEAIKYSSNVYQYKIAMMVGGFEYAYNKKLEMDLGAFNTYRNIFYQFGLGVSTGIDYPIEETGYKGGSSNGELLINFSIGQYDTYTTLQLAQYISTIANDGKRMKVHFLKSVLKDDDSGEILYNVDPVLLNEVVAEDKYIERIQQGMWLVMNSDGTGQFGYMNYIKDSAGKTGTSESFVDIDGDGVVDYESISNNFVGYAPFDNPTFAIATSSPDVQNPNRGDFKSSVNLRVSKQATSIYFKYYDTSGKRK